jgi:hypothetical protein
MEQMSVVELKAAAYDRLAIIEQCQGEIRQINAEIAKRAEAEEAKPEAAKEVKPKSVKGAE